MPTTVYRRQPAENPLSALQRKARRQDLHVLKASNFDAYRNAGADLRSCVLIFSLSGQQLAGPLALEDADNWLAMAKLAKLQGQPVGGAS